VTIYRFVKSLRGTPVRDAGRIREARASKSFRAETFYWIAQMASKVLQPLVYFPYFSIIKYERLHSKTWEASLTGELISSHLKELEYNEFLFTHEI